MTAEEKDSKIKNYCLEDLFFIVLGAAFIGIQLGISVAIGCALIAIGLNDQRKYKEPK